MEDYTNPKPYRDPLGWIVLFLIISTAAFVAAMRAADARADVDMELINGEPANPAEWPASVSARSNVGGCTATVVGERVLLIAAHCVSNGGTVNFSAGPNSYSARCTHSPDYRRNDTADWALCLVDKAVTGVPYESVVTDGSWCQVDREVRLTGYGCIRRGGGGGNDGIYRIGKAKVIRCPSGSDNDTVTRGGAALCYGDSGGPAFVEYSDGRRELFGVNSRGDINVTSYLSSVWTPQAKSFIEKWQRDNDQVICGYPGARGCRDASSPDPDPQPDPDPLPGCEEEIDAVGASLDAHNKAVSRMYQCLKGGRQ